MYDDLLMFVKFVEIGSFVGTAKYYNTTQPTITRRMQALEDKLGYELLKRNSRSFEITDAGKKIYKNLAGCENIIENTLEEIQIELKHNKVRLRIALPPAISYHLITPRAV